MFVGGVLEKPTSLVKKTFSQNLGKNIGQRQNCREPVFCANLDGDLFSCM